ncbi:MAG: TonB family protein [Sulfurimicrobium sp.]|nr:TonB family protein [Sulfurimicrobium sp.]
MLLYRYREAFAASQSLLFLGAILALASLISFKPKLPPLVKETPMQLTLVEQVAPKPIARPVPPLAPPRPITRAPKVAVPLTLPHALPTRDDSTSAPVASVQPVAMPAHPEATHAQVAPQAVASQPTVDPALAAEASYVTRVRGHLKSIKRYPTGREASLQRSAGIAVVWFILSRNGELIDQGIETSSGSLLLNAAALSTIKRGNYPPFPDDAWAGKAQHRFTVELDFAPAS